MRDLPGQSSGLPRQLSCQPGQLIGLPGQLIGLPWLEGNFSETLYKGIKSI